VAGGPRSVGGLLLLAAAADRSDLGAFLSRIVRLNADAVVRLRRSVGAVEAWSWLPVDVLVTRRVAAQLDPVDVTVTVADLLARLDAAACDVALPPACDDRWRGTLPGPAGWRLLETVPASEVLALVKAGAEAFRAAATVGAAASQVADSLLSHESLTVDDGDLTVAVPMRVLQSLARMGFLAADGDVSIAAGPTWLLLDAAYGSAYLRRGAGLGLLPV